MKIDQIVKVAIDASASDIHLSTGMKPMIRVLGELQEIENSTVLTDESIVEMHSAIATAPEASEKSYFGLRQNKTNRQLTDFAFLNAPTNRRLRVNAFVHDRGPAMAMRLIPEGISTFEQLGTPEIIEKLCQLPNGLVIVTGPVGVGKTATTAAMIEYINQQRSQHILTLEDPIEHRYIPSNCLISQREVHLHAGGYSAALKDAVRQDIDVIFVGEMQDLDTIKMALTAAQLGRLVIATMHTASAPKAIDRIVDVFPGSEKELVRTMLAECLQAVISQRLVRHKTEARRVAVFETMICTTAIRSSIKDGKIGQLRGQISTGRDDGMMTLEQSLQEKIQLGQIDLEVAKKYSAFPQELKFHK